MIESKHKTDAYVIVTPAFNEARFITATIESVLFQKLGPRQWIIVDDGSTDDTPSIIKKYAAQYPLIQYYRREKVAGQPYYASNVFAVQKGIDCLKNTHYEYLAILDADITLPCDYYKQLLFRFNQDEQLGIASGIYHIHDKGRLEKALNDRRSCPKNIMVFRKECYQGIGGFVPMKYGGEDTVACFMARMKGWRTWSFPDLVAIHNKPVGSGHASNRIRIRFRHGVGDYYMATHPLFELVKTIRRCIREKPYLVGGIARLIGFCYASIFHEPRQLSPEVIRFIRAEQYHRVFQGNRIPRELIPLESFDLQGSIPMEQEP